MAAPDSAARAQDELLRLQAIGQRFHDRIDYLTACVKNGAPADFDNISVRQHAIDRRLRRPLHILIQQTLAHQHGLDMIALVLSLQ